MDDRSSGLCQRLPMTPIHLVGLRRSLIRVDSNACPAPYARWMAAPVSWFQSGSRARPVQERPQSIVNATDISCVTR
jgi:hypothetical protein